MNFTHLKFSAQVPSGQLREELEGLIHIHGGSLFSTSDPFCCYEFEKGDGRIHATVEEKQPQGCVAFVAFLGRTAQSPIYTAVSALQERYCGR